MSDQPTETDDETTPTETTPKGRKSPDRTSGPFIRPFKEPAGE